MLKMQDEGEGVETAQIPRKLNKAVSAEQHFYEELKKLEWGLSDKGKKCRVSEKFPLWGS